VEHEAAEALGVERANLADQLGLVQVVVPEPEGHDPESARRIGKGVVEWVHLRATLHIWTVANYTTSPHCCQHVLHVDTLAGACYNAPAFQTT
jgi:hypothetical protein